MMANTQFHIRNQNKHVHHTICLPIKSNIRPTDPFNQRKIKGSNPNQCEIQAESFYLKLSTHIVFLRNVITVSANHQPMINKQSQSKSKNTDCFNKTELIFNKQFNGKAISNDIMQFNMGNASQTPIATEIVRLRCLAVSLLCFSHVHERPEVLIRCKFPICPPIRFVSRKPLRNNNKNWKIK